MSRPRVLHTEESDGWGGQEIRILAEMTGMKARGYDVLLATPGHTTIFKRASEAGIETFDVPMDRRSFMRGTMALAGIIRKRGVDIVNTHSSRDSWMGGVAGRLAGVKVLRTRHISSEIRKNPLSRLVYGPLCDGIMTTGEFIRGQLVRELGMDARKVYSVPTGIDVGRFADADGEGVRAGLGIAPGVPVLGTAAALRSWKGHLYTINAMTEVLKSFPDARLVLAGEGPFRGKVEQTISELGLSGIVILTGHREDVPEVINAFDVCILASYASEGIPQFVLQAMASGKPVIGSRVGGIPEVVADGVNGLLIQPRDSDAIAKAVRRLLDDRVAMKEMGERGRKAAVEAHTTDIMLDRIEAVYSMLDIRRHAGGRK
jgi:glycosyltransferase involved in cell wall biosynthesis